MISLADMVKEFSLNRVQKAGAIFNPEKLDWLNGYYLRSLPLKIIVEKLKKFIPTAWLLFELKVAELTGHNPPSPWNVEDAFTASAIFLAEAGAQSKTRTGELAAARTYISGRPSCPSRGLARYACQAYANRVLSLAEDIDRVI